MEQNSYLMILLCCLTLLQSANAVTYTETLSKGQSIGTSDTLVSANGSFELGFFTRENSTKFYVGIWFKKVRDNNIVWVANRKHAISASSAILTLYDDGNLVVMEDEIVHFLTNITTNLSSINVMLLDSGNLLLLHNPDLKILWQSFDNPTNTLLLGMNLGFDQVTGLSWSLRSWVSSEDPSPGNFSLQVEADFNSQMLIIWKDSEIYWVGDEVSNFTFQSSNNRSNTIWNRQEYLTWQGEYTSRLVLEVSGELNQQFWSQDSNQWVSLQSARCGRNALCGNFSICNPQAKKPCECLKGFKPYDEISWIKGDTSKGCVRKTELLCSSNTSSSNNGQGDWFCQLDRVDFSFPADAFKTNDTLSCEKFCLGNCSCSAYVFDFSGNCSLWLDQVLNMTNISVDVRDDKYKPSFFLRLDRSEFINNVTNTPYHNPNARRHKVSPMIIVVVILFVTLLTIASFAYYYRRRKLRGKGENLLLFDVGMSMKVQSSELTDEEKPTKLNKNEVKLPLFSFASVSTATNSFSSDNKLGEGGFGPVYKGILLNGDEVAVKRLSTRSGQGWEELKNEALLIAKLQHNNLVRLFGCCIEGDEKMLIYEFMPNKSLDFFLFDRTKSKTLDWTTRVRIIDGIAQGLLYLHQYSRLRIIHRDLKASNILLDINMNPKISDFGMARMFGSNELQANTNRIVGTYGYMSPEYALEGLFSIKSDVFSFGILLLEIISGKKSTGRLYSTNSLNLLGYAWDLWTSGRGTELIDSVIDDASIKKMEVERYVNIALLCVEERPDDRPSMSDVVSMLGNETAILPRPKLVAFINVSGMKNSRSDGSSSSINVMTTSVMEAR